MRDFSQKKKTFLKTIMVMILSAVTSTQVLAQMNAPEPSTDFVYQFANQSQVIMRATQSGAGSFIRFKNSNSEKEWHINVAKIQGVTINDNPSGRVKKNILGTGSELVGSRRVITALNYLPSVACVVLFNNSLHLINSEGDIAELPPSLKTNTAIFMRAWSLEKKKVGGVTFEVVMSYDPEQAVADVFFYIRQEGQHNWQPMSVRFPLHSLNGKWRSLARDFFITKEANQYRFVDAEGKAYEIPSDAPDAPDIFYGELFNGDHESPKLLAANTTESSEPETSQMELLLTSGKKMSPELTQAVVFMISPEWASTTDSDKLKAYKVIADNQGAFSADSLEMILLRFVSDWLGEKNAKLFDPLGTDAENIRFFGKLKNTLSEQFKKDLSESSKGGYEPLTLQKLVKGVILSGDMQGSLNDVLKRGFKSLKNHPTKFNDPSQFDLDLALIKAVRHVGLENKDIHDAIYMQTRPAYESHDPYVREAEMQVKAEALTTLAINDMNPNLARQALSSPGMTLSLIHLMAKQFSFDLFPEIHMKAVDLISKLNAEILSKQCQVKLITAISATPTVHEPLALHE